MYNCITCNVVDLCITYVITGMVLGGVGTFPATSALCQWTWFDGGWPSVFYVFGEYNLCQY